MLNHQQPVVFVLEPIPVSGEPEARFESQMVHLGIAERGIVCCRLSSSMALSSFNLVH